MTINATLINILHLCHRKLWLHAHAIRMEHTSDIVAPNVYSLNLGLITKKKIAKTNFYKYYIKSQYFHGKANHDHQRHLFQLATK